MYHNHAPPSILGTRECGWTLCKCLSNTELTSRSSSTNPSLWTGLMKKNAVVALSRATPWLLSDFDPRWKSTSLLTTADPEWSGVTPLWMGPAKSYSDNKLGSWQVRKSAACTNIPSIIGGKTKNKCNHKPVETVQFDIMYSPQVPTKAPSFPMAAAIP